MPIHQKLHQRLAQKLILTPSLQQAIKLLPMTTLELAELLNQEMVENPMLEEVPTEDLAAQETPATEQPEPEKKPDEKGDTWDDQDYDYFFGEYLNDDSYRSRQPQEVKELPPIENTLSSKGSLADHLLWQLNLQQADDLTREIGAAIIGNIDDDGYLVASVNEIAALGPWDVSAVEQALEHIQAFDPPGVAARDPRECLLLQLKPLGLGDSPVETIIREHLHLLQNNRLPELAKLLGCDIDEAKQHVEVIKHLDPKPGARYSPADSQYVIPDVYIVKTEDGYKAVLNEDGLPQLRISPVYRRLLDKGGEASDETRAYVKDKFRAALWLLKSVDQRQKTIVKVATSIINFQRAFLDQGIEHLRPLVLRDVANDIGMHESTVSRVVNNKYVHTPQGVYELKFFFHSGISSSYGESVSSVTIKQRIKKIIEAEDAKRPLSDSKIMNILQKEGLVLARRTIAKYREELKIQTSNQRKILYLNQRTLRMMTVTITGRHIEMAAGTRRQIENKIAALQKVLNGSAVSAHCVITQERLRVNCELTLHAPGDHMLVGIGRHPRLVTAVGLAIEKVSQQARRLADRWKTRKRETRRRTELPVIEPAAAERTPRVIRARGYSVKPLSLEDAILTLDQQPFLVFRDAESERVAVLFRRPDGHLGLIDAGA